MGKKYIIEVEDKPFELLSEDGFTSEKLFRVKGFNSLVFDWNGLNMLTPYTEDSAYAHGYTEAESKYREIRDELEKQAYQRGLADAWDAARKICTNWVLPDSVLSKIFGMDKTIDDIMKENKASEVIAKIQAYEQEKEEIQVGDEVIIRYKKAVVTEITDRFVRIMYSDGSGYALFSKNMTKTGRHFPEIAEVLAKMKETDNG